ncbi:hypothetical protein GO986_10205 [Deinococcus sp. HMF7620]|uniref:Pectate lyase superfamily protein domain-containing protein n=1 Tax=Deinococcus arboris TaxID=2682977 RepID=A0A7C9LR69_9DEIO|nr:right-handed parallel beta-helix repeat-containing protein [Deinococcus arboris]MVN87141.1 hypothetical protein [Deinococcus arboris]
MNAAPLVGLGASLLLGAGLVQRAEAPPGSLALPLATDTAPAGVVAQAAPQRPSVSVTAFGARGDGTTDDTAALNRAASQAAGRDLMFPAGTYLIRGPVVFSGFKDQTVRGAPGATIRAAPDYQRGKVEGMLHFDRPVGVTVRDLKVVGQRVPGANPYATVIDGIRVTQGRNITLTGLHILDAPTNGIGVEDTDTVTLRGNVLERAGGAGGWSHRTVHQRWLNNTVIGLGDPGGKALAGLGFFATIGDDFLAEGNVLNNISNTATKTEGVHHVVYRNNTVDVFGKDGIKVMPYTGATATVEGAVIENNTVRARRSWAPDGSAYILMHSVNGGQIRGNRIEGTGGQPEVYSEDAIKVNTWASGPPSRNIVIEGNQVRDTRRGIRIEADNVVLRGNTVTGRLPWARSAVIVGSNGVSIADNLFDGPAVGVLIDRGFGRTRIENNRFDHVETAVYADNGNPAVTVSRNTFGAAVQKAVAGAVGRDCNFYNSPECRAP